MTILKNYNEFAGRHMETGTVGNALAYQGVKAPHTGKPVSEALLMGISGGAAFGYFTFEYSGYRPHIALLTHNTFNPLDTLLERLAIPQDIFRTDNPQKGETNLLEVLEGGRPALVWADMFSLPYNDLPYDLRNWGMAPVLVYGYEDGIAYLADRSSCPLKVSAEDLNRARGRVKKDEYRVVMLGAPDWSRLPSAVSQGIWQCVSLYTEAPPKGKRDNFGLAALQQWAKMLTNTRNKQSWARYFPPGERMWMALVGDRVQPGAYGFLNQGAGNTAERGMYADFLDEAAVILNRAGLKDAAQAFRQAEAAWSQLCDMLLPDDVPAFKETKDLLRRKYNLFIEQGADVLADIRRINERLQALREAAAKDFPLSEAQATSFREGLAEQVLAVHDLERSAVECLQAAMG
jgi:hypothetical protein